jgi:hypothetical protein
MIGLTVLSANDTLIGGSFITLYNFIPLLGEVTNKYI